MTENELARFVHGQMNKVLHDHYNPVIDGAPGSHYGNISFMTDDGTTINIPFLMSEIGIAKAKEVAQRIREERAAFQYR